MAWPCGRRRFRPPSAGRRNDPNCPERIVVNNHPVPFPSPNLSRRAAWHNFLSFCILTILSIVLIFRIEAHAAPLPSLERAPLFVSHRMGCLPGRGRRHVVCWNRAEILADTGSVARGRSQFGKSDRNSRPRPNKSKSFSRQVTLIGIGPAEWREQRAWESS
jgi:hypothetical protein